MFDDRDKLSLLIEALEQGKRASEYAREIGVSKQAVHQVIKKSGINYRVYMERIARKRNMRYCEWCRRLFYPRKNGATWNCCSEECAKEYKKGL